MDKVKGLCHPRSLIWRTPICLWMNNGSVHTGSVTTSIISGRSKQGSKCKTSFITPCRWGRSETWSTQGSGPGAREDICLPDGLAGSQVRSFPRQSAEARRKLRDAIPLPLFHRGEDRSKDYALAQNLCPNAGWGKMRACRKSFGHHTTLSGLQY